jgi:DNA repair photolyase
MTEHKTSRQTLRHSKGTREWSDHSANLYLGCTNGCKYCYACARARRVKQIQSAAEWLTPRPLRTVKHYRRRVSGVIMFPTTHDITLANLPQCAAYLEEMLRPGNQVLIVSKPSLVCIEHLTQRLSPWRKQIELRFTISACDNALIRYWEPGAPTVAERVAALDCARNADYRVSISMEPMLDPENVALFVHNLENWRPETIWIGKMNDIRRRVHIVTEEDRRHVADIYAGQTDDRILSIVRALKDDPLIRWKDSIQEVIERHARGNRRCTPMNADGKGETQ